MRKFILILLVGISAELATAQNQWKLIYENDADGNVVIGEINELIKAIRNGEPLRVYFIMGGDQVYVEHTANVKFTTIMNAQDKQIVTAQIDPIGGQIPDFKEWNVLLKENLEWSVIISTAGRNDQMTRNTVTGEIIEHSIRNWGTKWFVVVKD